MGDKDKPTRPETTETGTMTWVGRTKLLAERGPNCITGHLLSYLALRYDFRSRYEFLEVKS